MLCSLGMQQCTNSLHPWSVAVWVCDNAQCAIHNATIQKTTFFESEVYSRVENCKVEILSHLQEESQLITFNEILL